MSQARQQKKVVRIDPQPGGKSPCLRDSVRMALEAYFADLDGHEAADLYELMLSQVEEPLFEVVMENTRGNLTHAAQLLGMNRGTLRSRLKKYGLDGS